MSDYGAAVARIMELGLQIHTDARRSAEGAVALIRARLLLNAVYDKNSKAAKGNLEIYCRVEEQIIRRFGVQ